MIFKKMKKTAEAHLGTEVTDAVISVPAYYCDSQREATRNAGAVFIIIWLSQKDWELANSRIWLVESNIESGLDFPLYTGYVLRWKRCKVKNKIIDNSLQRVFIYVGKEDNRFWQN